MKYILVDGQGNPEFTQEDVVAGMEALGYSKTGENRNQCHRKELQGQPMFNGLLGPMFDGPDRIRYETPEMNDALST